MLPFKFLIVNKEERVSEELAVGFLDAVEMIVEGVDLTGYPCVPARHALELLAQAEPEFHLRAVQDNDASALAVYTHGCVAADPVQRAPL